MASLKYSTKIGGLLLVLLLSFVFTPAQEYNEQREDIHLYSLKQELQDTIREIQNYGEPPDYEKHLSETIQLLQQKQYPQSPTSYDNLSWLPATPTNNTQGLRLLDVCIVVSSLEGLYINSGIGTTYYSLSLLLAQHGNSVTIIYTRDEPTTSGSFSDWVNFYKTYNITLQVLPPSQKRVANPKLQSRSYRVYRYLRESGFDVIHFGDFEGLGYYSTVAKHAGLAFQNTTLVVGLHGPTRWVVDSNMNRGLLHESELEVDWMERISVEYADVVWTPSSYLASWLSNQSWILPSKVFLLPLPPGPEVKTGSTLQSPLVKIRAEELVFFGRLETRKGLVLFCDALDLLAKLRFIKPAELVVTFMGTIGYVDTKDAGSYIRRRSSSWPFRVQILSDMNRTQALDYLRSKERARLAVIPSLVDNAPYTVYECLYAGIPFVASATPSILPLLSNEMQKTEHLFETKSYALVRKLVSAVRDGVGSAAGIFTASQAEDTWLSFYATLNDNSVVNPSKTSSPFVSVCITHYNRPALLKQALGSIESQDYSNYEVILVDDGSNSTEVDNYLKSIQPYFQTKGWTIIRTQNRYLGAARNTAAQHAKGKYILFIDDDNFAYPQQISTYVKVAERTQAHVFSSVHAIFRGVLPPEEQKIERYSVPLGPSLPVGLFKNCFGDANFFVLREAFLSSGGFTEDFGVGLEDHEFFATAIFNLTNLLNLSSFLSLMKNIYKLVIIPEPLLYYRIHDVLSQMVFTTDPRLGEARRLRPYVKAVAGNNSDPTSPVAHRSRRSMLSLVARNALNPREDCNQTLSSVNPGSGPISGGTIITIKGTGFSCGVQSIKIGGQDCSGLHVFSNYELSCIVPPGLSAYTPLDVVAEVAGASVVLYASWIYTPLAAPAMVWCKLQDTGVTVLCYFDSATDEGSNSTNCDLFTNETRSTLGTEPRCYWINPKTVAIDLGAGATITFSDQLSVREGAVNGQGASGQPNRPASLVLQKPDNPVRPIASLSAPTNIGQCEGIVLDGSGSTGGAGRALNVTWTLLSVIPTPFGEAEETLKQTLDSANALQLFKIELSNSSLSVHSAYSFSFHVTSWLEQSDTAVVTVTKRATNVPQVTISGPSVLQIYRNIPITLQGSVSASACGDSSEALSVLYSWSVFPSVSLDPASRTSSSLYVPENVLLAGKTYQFSLLVTDSSQKEIRNSANVTVVVGLRDIVAKISGGNQHYYADEVVQLDGSSSSDPDNVAPLVYLWDCTSFYDSTLPCNTNLPANAKISLDADVLGHGKWQFNLRVSSQSNNARYSTASAYIEIADSIVLSVSIEALNSSTVDPNQKVILRGVLKQANVPESEVDWNWFLISGSLLDSANAYSSPLNSQILVIKPGSLTPGSTYTYRVVASHILSGTNGSASISLKVATAPTAGGFTCPELSGNQDDTAFEFDFGSQWSSASGIIGYSVSFLPNDGSLEIPLVDSSLNTKISTRIPAGPSKVVGYVFSGTGVASRQECPSSLMYANPSQGLQLLDDQSKDQASTVYDIARIAYSAKSAVQQISQGPPSDLILDIRTNLLQLLQGQLNSVSRYTTNFVTAAVGSLIPITDSRFGTLPFSSELAAAFNLLQSLVNLEAGLSLDLTTLGANVEVLGNIVSQLNDQLSPIPQVKSARSVADTADYWSLYSQVTPLASDIAGLFIGKTDNGETALIITRNRLAVGVYKDTAQKVDAQGFSIGSGTIPEMSLPAGFVPENFVSAQSLQFKYLSIGGSPYPVDTRLSLASDVLTLYVTEDSNQLTLVDMNPTARLTFPMSGDLNGMQCMWYNDSTWTTAGCETQAKNEHIICLCDRVATMAVMHVVSTFKGSLTSTAGTRLSAVWIGVIAAGGGLVIIGVVIGVFVVKRRARARASGSTTPATNSGSNANPAAVNPEALAAAVATAASLSAQEGLSSTDDLSEAASLSSRSKARATSSVASSPASSFRSGSSSSSEEIMEYEIKSIAKELNKQLPRDTRALEQIVNKMDME